MSSKENCSVSKKIRMRVKGDEINGEKWQRKTERDRQCKQVLLKPDALKGWQKEKIWSAARNSSKKKKEVLWMNFEPMQQMRL